MPMRSRSSGACGSAADLEAGDDPRRGRLGKLRIAVADRLGAGVGAQRAELRVADRRCARPHRSGRRACRTSRRRCARPAAGGASAPRAPTASVASAVGRLAPAVDALPVVAGLAARAGLAGGGMSSNEASSTSSKARSGMRVLRWRRWPAASPEWTRSRTVAMSGGGRPIGVEVRHALANDGVRARPRPCPGRSGARKSSPWAAHSASMARTCSARSMASRRWSAAVRAHADVVLLVRAGRDRVDRCRMGQRLELVDERRGGVVGDHQAALDARPLGEEGGQARRGARRPAARCAAR